LVNQEKDIGRVNPSDRVRIETLRFRAWQGPRSSKKKKIIMEKLKFLHTFKAHHRILRQILCKNTKFQINRIKIKTLCSKLHSTAQDARPYILALKGFGYG